MSDDFSLRKKITALTARMDIAKEMAQFMRATQKPVEWVATADYTVTLIHKHIKELEKELAFKAVAPFAVHDPVWMWLEESSEWLPGTVTNVGVPGKKQQAVVVACAYTYVGSAAVHAKHHTVHWPLCRSTLVPRDPADTSTPPHPSTIPFQLEEHDEALH